MAFQNFMQMTQKALQRLYFNHQSNYNYKNCNLVYQKCKEVHSDYQNRDTSNNINFPITKKGQD